jgi:hypothetical protein
VNDGNEAGGDKKAQAIPAKQKDAIAQIKEDMCEELANRLVASPGTSGPCGQTTEAPTLQTPPAGTVSSASGKSADLQKFKPTQGLKLKQVPPAGTSSSNSGRQSRDGQAVHAHESSYITFYTIPSLCRKQATGHAVYARPKASERVGGLKYGVHYRLRTIGHDTCATNKSEAAAAAISSAR